jgi:hypothetical protein
MTAYSRSTVVMGSRDPTLHILPSLIGISRLAIPKNNLLHTPDSRNAKIPKHQINDLIDPDLMTTIPPDLVSVERHSALSSPVVY